MTSPHMKAAVNLVAAVAASKKHAENPQGQTVSSWLYDIHQATKNVEAAVEKSDFKEVLNPLVELVATVLAASFDVADKCETQVEIHKTLDSAFGDDKALALATLVSRRNIQTRRQEIIAFGGEVMAHFETPRRSYVLDQVIEQSLRSYGFREAP